MNLARPIHLKRIKAVAMRGGRFVWEILLRFDRDRCGRAAGALSFASIFSLVPLTAVVFGMLSIFPVFQSWMGAIQDFVYGNFVPASGEVVQRYLEEFSKKAGRLTALGLLLVIVTAIMMMDTIEQTFNDIWRVRQQRKLMHRLLTYWAILTLGPFLIGASLSLTSQLFSLPLFGGQGVFHGARGVVLQSLPMVFEILAFFMLYTLVPNAPVKWRHALAGGVCAALLFELAKHGFAQYVMHVPTYQTIYGAVAVLPIFLVWVYLSWLVILLGAVVTAQLGEGHTSPKFPQQTNANINNSTRRRKDAKKFRV
jgi:membrane protein